MAFKLILLLLLPLIFLLTQTADSEPTNKIIHRSDPPSPVPERSPTSNIPPEAAAVGAAEAPKEAAAEAELEAKEEEKEQRKRHIDKSVAGGGVILGGLITAVCMAVFCYIRVTRKRDDELLPIVIANRKSTDALAVTKLQQQSIVVSSSPAPAPVSA